MAKFKPLAWLAYARHRANAKILANRPSLNRFADLLKDLYRLRRSRSRLGCVFPSHES
jgi:hypothetical protein